MKFRKMMAEYVDETRPKQGWDVIEESLKKTPKDQRVIKSKIVDFRRQGRRRRR